jgi:hypothetical protein
MKNSLFSLSLLSIMVLSTPILLNATRTTKMGPLTKKDSAQEWLEKNTSHEQKKMIANLRMENELQSLKMGTFTFIPYGTAEHKMFFSFPDYVQAYLTADWFDSICWEGEHFRFANKLCNGLASCSEQDKSLDMIKIRTLPHHKLSSKDIANFNSNTYDFAQF